MTHQEPPGFPDTNVEALRQIAEAARRYADNSACDPLGDALCVEVLDLAERALEESRKIG